jgi:hypothetical protein
MNETDQNIAIVVILFLVHLAILRILVVIIGWNAGFMCKLFFFGGVWVNIRSSGAIWGDVAPLNIIPRTIIMGLLFDRKPNRLRGPLVLAGLRVLYGSVCLDSILP